MAILQRRRPTVVDIACRDASGGCYSGEERARQSVELKFGDFVDFYCAAHAGAAHWLGDVEDLEFYLCQCPIAVLRPDATCAAPVLPRVMDDFIMCVSRSLRVEHHNDTSDSTMCASHAVRKRSRPRR